MESYSTIIVHDLFESTTVHGVIHVVGLKIGGTSMFPRILSLRADVVTWIVGSPH